MKFDIDGNAVRDMNYENFERENKSMKVTRRKLLFAILRDSPREEVIAVCKKLKILHEDLNLKTNKLEIMEREE